MEKTCGCSPLIQVWCTYRVREYPRMQGKMWGKRSVIDMLMLKTSHCDNRLFLFPCFSVSTLEMWDTIDNQCKTVVSNLKHIFWERKYRSKCEFYSFPQTFILNHFLASIYKVFCRFAKEEYFSRTYSENFYNSFLPLKVPLFSGQHLNVFILSLLPILW